MTAHLLDGRPLAARIEKEASEESALFMARSGRKPCLAVVLVGDNAASEVYVRRKKEACLRTGIDFRLINRQDTLELATTIADLSSNQEVDGIVLQLPLPRGESPAKYFSYISPSKDVDVFNPKNVGLLDQNRLPWQPPTPGGILRLLSEYEIPVAGKNLAILNRSWVVGRPLASMALHCQYNATVTVCHDATPPEATTAHCLAADVIVVAVGIPGFVGPSRVREGQTIVDVGINRVENRIVGDVDPAVAAKVAYLTPVPGGVGPVTVAVLMLNVCVAAKLRREDGSIT